MEFQFTSPFQEISITYFALFCLQYFWLAYSFNLDEPFIKRNAVLLKCSEVRHATFKIVFKNSAMPKTV